MKHAAILTTLALGMAGCAVTDTTGSRIAGPNIQKEAVDLSHTYRDTTNAIIFSAVLESRDRGLSNLSTMSGMTSSPTVTTKGNLSFSPLGLGNAVGPFTGSESSIGQDRKAGVQYKINPFVKEAGSGAGGTFAPVPSAVFANYWNNGWPPEVLMSLMVEKITIYSADGKTSKPLVNRANNFNLSDMKDRHELAKLEQGCGYLGGRKIERFGQDYIKRHDFMCLARGIFGNFRDYEVNLAMETKKANCQDLSENALRQLTGASPHSNAQSITNIKEINELSAGKITFKYDASKKAMVPKYCASNATTVALVPKNAKAGQDSGYIVFELRSLDSMIYFAGETLREENVFIKGPDKCGVVPLLTTYRSQRPDPAYAVSTKHLGAYESTVKRSFGDSCPPDRAQTVMTILNQLFHISQSKDFLKAPDDIFQRL